MARANNSGTVAKELASITNQGYFTDYFLGYRLDAGLDGLYKAWESAEREGHPTARTRVRALSKSFGQLRPDASEASPDRADGEGALDLGLFAPRSIEALKDLNDSILGALGWEPDRSESAVLTSADQVIHVPVAHRCETSSGTLLLALDTVFTTDPSKVMAGKDAEAGTLLDPVRVGDKAVATTVSEAAQLIFTADDPPNYLLLCSGGAVTLLDRNRWGEGVFLGADLDEALARGDAKPKGELAAIAALFSSDAINPEGDAQSFLSRLLDAAANESAGVSKDLRHGVRRSVELLANAVVHDVRYRQKGAWRQIDPDDLTRQSLRYLYRIIVLLFAEARPELGILPVDDPDYQAGYSLARLRDTSLTELHSDLARNGTHLQESLEVLFEVVNKGYSPPATLHTDARGLTFAGLGSKLFGRDACPLLDRARIPDETLQQVLVNLCFTREKSGRQRHVLSYATLGINQLGAVYEGLMAYKGFLATEELYEIDNDGDPDNGSWVIPVDQADEFDDSVFLMEEGPDGQERRVKYSEGDFVFRLSGRDRQRSASYYTPEVLTEFTVRHTLDVYWEEHPDLTARDILSLTVCEPALGSGAFLNEAINQLAARYLKAAQDEMGETVDPDEYQNELQKAKAHFAINQAYGVDLNPTAVELAEVSLWLNCMHEGLAAPDLGSRLRRGNSLIGARRATYTEGQIKKVPWKGTKASPVIPPTEQRIDDVPLGHGTGVHHFLLPEEGWGAAADAVELKGKGGARPVAGLAEEWSEAVREWRKSIQKAPDRRQIDRLSALARRVETAWRQAATDAEDFRKSHNRRIDVWGANRGDLPTPGLAGATRYLDPEGPASRLRLLMNAWVSLWMWAPANGADLPTLDRWLDAVELLLGQPESEEVGELFNSYELEDGLLDSVERFGKSSVAEVLERHPWLGECRQIAATQAFFHWELEHAHVFINGGFDIQVGNPPWVRLDWDDPACLAESDPWWGIADLKSVDDTSKGERRRATLARDVASDRYARDRAENEGLARLLGSTAREPALSGIRTNLYMVFMTNTWSRNAVDGVIGLVHPESHFVDPSAGALRAATYRRLRRHWQFRNVLFLFEDVDDHITYGVHVYGAEQSPSFLQATNLAHPATLDASLHHDGTGETPGIQHPDGGQDLRPHAQRIVRLDLAVLRDWVRLFDEAGTEAEQSRLFRPLTERDLDVLTAFARFERRIGDVVPHWSVGFNEKLQKDDGTIAWDVAVPRTLDDLILQGPHLLNGSAWGQQPRTGYLNNNHWEPLNLETANDDLVPRALYRRSVDASVFVARQPRWGDAPYSRFYREVHREWVNPGEERTLKSGLIPRGPSTIGSLVAMAFGSSRDTAFAAGLFSSLPYDYVVKVSGVTHIKKYVSDALPFPVPEGVLAEAILLRTLRLNCITSAYSHLWETSFSWRWVHDDFIAGTDASVSLGEVGPDWNSGVVLRSDYDRWLALTEIDAAVAMMLGLDEDQLIQMYRSQFAVLVKNEGAMVFDARGQQICSSHHAYRATQTSWEAEAKAAPAKRGEAKVKMWDRVQMYREGDTSVDLGPFVPPFKPADREASMRRAYRAFAVRLEEETS